MKRITSATGARLALCLMTAAALLALGSGEALARGGGFGGGGFHSMGGFGGGRGEFGGGRSEFSAQDRIGNATPARNSYGDRSYENRSYENRPESSQAYANRDVNVNTGGHNVVVNNEPGRYGPGPYPNHYGPGPYPGPAPYPVPVPVGPAYYGGGFAAGMAAGAMLTVLPAAAVAYAAASGETNYRCDGACYRQVVSGGQVVYQQIPCP